MAPAGDGCDRISGNQEMEQASISRTFPKTRQSSMEYWSRPPHTLSVDESEFADFTDWNALKFILPFQFGIPSARRYLRRRRKELRMKLD